MTRAQDHLYLTHAARRTRHGREQDRTPSPFLAGLGEDVAERVRHTAPKRSRATQLSLL